MATFPTYAKLVLEGFKKDRESALQRTDMERGPPKQPRIKSRVLVTRKLTYAFDSKTDYNNFLTWFNTSINRGAAWFDWTDPETSTVKKARIVNGKLSEEKPLNSALSLWQVMFDLETWE